MDSKIDDEKTLYDADEGDRLLKGSEYATPTISNANSGTSTPLTPGSSSSPFLEAASGPPRALPSLVIAIPFPDCPVSAKSKAAIPPFVLYSPLARQLEKPKEGEKEALTRKAQRHWEEEKAAARQAVTTGTPTFRNKAIGFIGKAVNMTKNSRIEFLGRQPGKGEMTEVKVLHPPEYRGDIKTEFINMLKAVKTKALRNGVLSVAIMPVTAVVDFLIVVPGPLEINALFAAASWTGYARASSMTSVLTSDQVPISFIPSPLLASLTFRLHEICWEQRKPTTPMEQPYWRGDYPPMTGREMAVLVYALITEHCGLGAQEEFEQDHELMVEDIENVLLKGAKEWLATIN